MSRGLLNITTEPCDECPFKGRFQGLRSGRLKAIMDECDQKDTHFDCHKSLVGPTGSYPHYGGQQAVCAGWLEAAGGIERAPGQLIRIAGRLGAINYQAAP